MERGVVEGVEPLFQARNGETIYWLIVFKDGRRFAVHNNWFVDNSLKQGDEVEFEASNNFFVGKKERWGEESKERYPVLNKLRVVKEVEVNL